MILKTPMIFSLENDDDDSQTVLVSDAMSPGFYPACVRMPLVKFRQNRLETLDNLRRTNIHILQPTHCTRNLKCCYAAHGDLRPRKTHYSEQTNVQFQRQNTQSSKPHTGKSNIAHHGTSLALLNLRLSSCFAAVFIYFFIYLPVKQI